MAASTDKAGTIYQVRTDDNSLCYVVKISDGLFIWVERGAHGELSEVNKTLDNMQVVTVVQEDEVAHDALRHMIRTAVVTAAAVASHINSPPC